MSELPAKFLVVRTREDRPMTDDEPRIVQAHGYSVEELRHFLAQHTTFEIGGHTFEVVDRMVEQLCFTIQLVR